MSTERMPEERVNTADPPGRLRLPAEMVLIGLLLALLFLPFVNKAIHIDDYAFIKTGGMLDWNPLKAFPEDVPYQGKIFKAVSPHDSTHPILIPYVLKVLLAVFGDNEVLLHLCFLVFPAMALWGVAKIHTAFAPSSASNRMLLLGFFGSLPAFVVNAQNLMTDVPTLAFLLVGTALVVRAVVEHLDSALYWGGFWLTCAVFSSYQAVFFIPVLILFACSGHPSPGQRRKLVPVLLLPIGLLLAWSVLVYVSSGILPGLKGTIAEKEVVRGLNWATMWGRIYFDLSMIGASVLLLLPLRMVAASGRERVRCWLLLGGLCAISFWIAPVDGGGWLVRSSLAVFCGLGVLGLGVAGLDLKRWWSEPRARPLVLFCGGWLGATLAYNFFLLGFGSARYLLPLFPILFLVLSREIGLEASVFVKRLAVLLLACSIFWGGANAWADYYYAGSYRTMATEIIELGGTLKNGEQIWYVGEWGMRYYFDRAGARYLLADSLAPRPGDYVIIPEMPRFWAPAAGLQARLSPFATREFHSPLPLRLFNRRSGAGFYCHLWGMLPFALSTEPDEVFHILVMR